MTRSTIRPVSALLLVALMCAGCATDYPPAPPPREVLQYLLEPGDVLDVKVYEEPDLDQELTILPDGKVSVLPVGSLKAAGLTVTQLDEALTLAFSQHFTDPKVTVFIRRFANLNVYVGGEVEQPGIVLHREGLTSIMAIFDAGGFRDTAALTHIVILRDAGNGAAEVLQIDSKRVLYEGQRDIVLQPYDVVIVPRSKIASVNLWVEQYIRRVIPFNLNASLNYVFSNSILLF